MENLTHDIVEKAFNEADIDSIFVNDLLEKGSNNNWALNELDVLEQRFSKDSATNGICEYLKIDANDKNLSIIEELLFDLGIFFEYQTCDDLKTDFVYHCEAVQEEIDKCKIANMIF